MRSVYDEDGIHGKNVRSGGILCRFVEEKLGSRSFVLVSMVFGERECTHGNGE
jgi:hypothetical protein